MFSGVINVSEVECIDHAGVINVSEIEFLPGVFCCFKAKPQGNTLCIPEDFNTKTAKNCKQKTSEDALITPIYIKKSTLFCQ